MKYLGTSPKYIVLNLSLLASFAQAQTPTVTDSTTGVTDISVLPMAGPNMSDVIVDSNLTINNSATTYLNLYASCYGTNLRSVANPVSPASDIKATIKYISADGSTKSYVVKFPASLTMKSLPVARTEITPNTTVLNAAGVATSESFRTQMESSMIRVAMSSTKKVGVDIIASGTDFGGLKNSMAKSGVFTGITFEQIMPSTATYQQYMGWNGPLTASVRWYFAENAKTVSVYASFPGENQFCGGYFSPLMLKFKNPEVAPKVLARSKFPLTLATMDNPPNISWPSFLKEEDIYFLVVDLNSNKIADNGSELLGDVNGYENGFANLEIYDENKDGMIDQKDSVFAKLILWKDSNHNGINEKSETKQLKDLGVTSIALAFKNELSYVGDTAKILGPGGFSYIDKKGKSQSGAVWDVYMKVVPK
jgi:hypothetical protein